MKEGIQTNFDQFDSWSSKTYYVCWGEAAKDLQTERNVALVDEEN